VQPSAVITNTISVNSYRHQICQIDLGSATVGAKVRGDGIQVMYYKLAC
jgi:hypothetical protein